MSFVSSVFFLFLPAVLVLYWVFPGKLRWTVLLAASLLFYAWHNVWLLSLICLTILTSYLCARFMEEAETQKERKQAMVFCAVVCLGILFIFKYLDFAVGSMVSLSNLFGAKITFSQFNILLPMGISFYVFQTMSYTFDVYRGTVKAERHLGYYALFVTFFPQLVAGPIERPGDLMPQLKQIHRLRREDVQQGLRMLLQGYGKKVLIADYLAPFVDHVYDNAMEAPGVALAVATVFFAFQIYCDFSGYSDIAQGCARLMGIRLTDNFRCPYEAKSIREFWRRWHISLTGWFTDYLYIPLGGSRRGIWRTCRNTMITFLVSGLWHGANWTYVIWGGMHGLYLVAERLLWKKRQPGRVITFAAVCLAWVFFRSATVPEAFAVLGRIFSPWQITALLPGLGMTALELVVAIMLLCLLPMLERMPKLEPAQGENRLGSTMLLYWFGTIAIVVCRFLVLTQHGETVFIYFQF